MNRIFMTRVEALELLIKAHQAASDNIGGHAAGAALAKIETLDHLLLDVRAGRVTEFRAPDDTHVTIMD
ncbi:conserved protein of unknown function [Burkholderia multivorans]